MVPLCCTGFGPRLLPKLGTMVMTQRTEQLLRPLQKNRQRCQRVSDTGVRSVLKNQQSIKSLTEHISTILVIPWMVEESCTSWKRWFIPLFIYIYIFLYRVSIVHSRLFTFGRTCLALKVPPNSAGSASDSRYLRKPR